VTLPIPSDFLRGVLRGGLVTLCIPSDVLRGVRRGGFVTFGVLSTLLREFASSKCPAVGKFVSCATLNRASVKKSSAAA
jgi:hypothetical protein